MASTKRYERLARIYGMQSIHRRPRPKSEYSDMQTKACMKQKLIESQEGSNTYADDEEGFAEALKPVIKVEPESIVVVKTEDHDSANHNTKVGWQGDTELMQYYDFPEIKIKEEAGEEMYKRELVHGTRCPGPSHEVKDKKSPQIVVPRKEFVPGDTFLTPVKNPKDKLSSQFMYYMADARGVSDPIE
ncbi:hypothetical protein M7I_5406 [Glarea lozoyensis 74030]|uniref:Uncharacterized protein n=1 Tax=Glarea lozoyensis (strain ATCC 74030 / MF5533) TaxID=1104152 RepID=H0ERT5_GLAL7|nr:hypothetical protein M7I_5406 [Glarea lozoyensis 74030]